MDEEGVSKSCFGLVEAGGDTLYPMYFGIACALFAFKGLSHKGMDDERWFDVREKMLKGSAHLIGLLIWRVQKQQVRECELLQKLETQIQELKRRSTEHGRANERVVSIFAAKEQRWFGERKSLRQQIGALLNDLRILDRRKHDEFCELNKKLQEMELAVKTKNSVLEEEREKKRQVEERLKTAEALVEELTESPEQEGRVHASELWKHKSAFIELVSHQRQLEAELGRAHRRAETVKQHLDFVLEEKEESVFMLQKLSMELEVVRKDSEQKDKILSAMLRKSKQEKQMLLKEVKVSKSRMKHAETERWRTDSKSKYTFKTMLRKQVGSRLGARGAKNAKSDLHDDYAHDLETETVSYSPHSDDKGLLAETDEQLDVSADVKQLDGWVCLQAGKYKTSIEQNHQHELEAFSQQIRQKDEKLEAYYWRLLSTELESKRLSSQLQGLNQSISQLRHDKLILEALLVERETELKSLKDSIAMHLNSLNKQRNKIHSSRLELPLGDDMPWSKVKVTKRKTADKVLEADKCSVEVSEQVESEKDEETEHALEDASSFTAKCSESKESREELFPARQETSSVGVVIMQKEVLMNECMIKDRSLWKMNIHALGVSYKIKRLKQQLVMLERLTGKRGDPELEETEDQDQMRMKGFLLLLSLLNKQVTRYQTLQEKTDDLCKRMREKDLDVNRGDSKSNYSREKEDSRTLEHFLEETFQLQRFIVATGQKLMEIHSKIASGFMGVAEKLNGPTSFDMRRLSENFQGLFREVQRGIEVRIARIIGDVEGTLACDGIRSSQQ